MKKINVKENINKFINGEFELNIKPKEKECRRPTQHKEASFRERYDIWHDTGSQNLFKSTYNVASVIICLGIIFILLITVSYLPRYGDPQDPINNEVSERYVEKAIEETGAVNAVAGMILDYRAFDTFGESAVLFVASMSVFMLLKNEDEDKETETSNEKRFRDPIVKNIAKFIIPFLLIFGIYVVLNGHISPGGGFAGGSIMGASLILYSSAFGYSKVSKYLTLSFIKKVTFCALGFYCIAKGYSFFTGAHHIPTGIPLGTPGAILSSGLILPLNICVGAVVTCTMYSFYTLFTRGKI